MGEWVSLLKKEFKMARPRVLWGLVVLIVAGFVDVFLAYRFGRPGAATVLAFMAVTFHIFYLAIYMLKSLSSEWNNAHLWLHLPRSGWSLISAKLASGLIALLVSFGITCIFSLWVVAIDLNSFAQFNVLPQIELIWSAILHYGWMIVLLIITSAIYTGLWAMMISVAMASTRNFIKKEKGRFFVGVGVFLIPTWGIGALQNTSVYDLLVKWGTVNLPLTALNGIENVHVQPAFHVGEILFYTLVSAAVFYLSGWLLDNKVEV